MRIAYVCADRGIPIVGPTGSSTHVLEFVRALTERGHEVVVFAADPGTEANEVPCHIVPIADDPVLNEVRLQIGKRYRQVPGEPTPRASEVFSLLVNQAARLAIERAGGFDLIYERLSLWSVAGLQAARERGVPLFVEVNAPLSRQQQTYRELELADVAEAIERLVLAEADRILVTAEALIDYIHERGASRRNARLLPCGVGRSMFADLERRRPVDPDRFVLGFLGSLKPWHGIDVLVDAFTALRERSDAYRLLVVGDGPLRAYIELVCRQRGLLDFVELAGAVPHEKVPEYLARMDVGLAPYPPLDSFYFSPLKIWEYAAACVPIVASRSGEIPEFFEHKKAALLHTAGSVTKIVRHVERLRTEPGLGARLARRARRIAKERTWDRLAARFEDIAAKALAGEESE